jgi:hypothetical protein
MTGFELIFVVVNAVVGVYVDMVQWKNDSSSTLSF